MLRLSVPSIVVPLALLLLAGGVGCTTMPRGPAVADARDSSAVASATNAPTARLLKNIPTHRPTHLQKWNPAFWLGNLDDPDPPDWYRPDDPRRDGKWYCRNSLHNFTFYVIGIADKEFVRTGRHLGNFNPNDGWNWAVCRYKCVRLPMISYKRGRFLFYFGWRERGNFGIKLNFKNSHVK